MRRIDHFNLRSFDLNLLIAFDALLTELSVTRAAARLRIRQPAMSHALSQLRLLFGDDLLVRVGAKMEPTPRATSLVAPIRDHLLSMQQMLLTRPVFDPQRENRTFRIGMSDQLEALLIPPLIARLQREAKGIVVMTRIVSRENVFSLLDDGTIEFAVGSMPAGPSWDRRRLLYTDDHVCCFNPDWVGSPVITIEQYLAFPHAFVSKNGTLYGYLEEALTRAGVTPQVSVTTANFFSLLLLAAETPVLTTVPSRMAARFSERFHLVTSSLPFLLEPFRAELIWHQRLDKEDAATWFRAMLSHGVAA